jgi:hypothetical protein
MKYFCKILILLSFSNLFSQRKVATLQNILGQYDLLENDSIIYTIKQGEYFYYDLNYKVTTTINGKVGDIPRNLVQVIDSIDIIKFTFSKSDLVFKYYH